MIKKCIVLGIIFLFMLTSIPSVVSFKNESTMDDETPPDLSVEWRTYHSDIWHVEFTIFARDNESGIHQILMWINDGLYMTIPNPFEVEYFDMYWLSKFKSSIFRFEAINYAGLSTNVTVEGIDIFKTIIEFPKDDGPYRLTVLFNVYGSCALITPIKITKFGVILYPFIYFWNSSASMNFNCCQNEIVLVNGKNIGSSLNESISRRVCGYGFKGVQIYPIITQGKCDYIDIE